MPFVVRTKCIVMELRLLNCKYWEINIITSNHFKLSSSVIPPPLLTMLIDTNHVKRIIECWKMLNRNHINAQMLRLTLGDLSSRMVQIQATGVFFRSGNIWIIIIVNQLNSEIGITWFDLDLRLDKLGSVLLLSPAVYSIHFLL